MKWGQARGSMQVVFGHLPVLQLVRAHRLRSGRAASRPVRVAESGSRAVRFARQRAMRMHRRPRRGAGIMLQEELSEGALATAAWCGASTVGSRFVTGRPSNSPVAEPKISAASRDDDWIAPWPSMIIRPREVGRSSRFLDSSPAPLDPPGPQSPANRPCLSTASMAAPPSWLPRRRLVSDQPHEC